MKNQKNYFIRKIDKKKKHQFKINTFIAKLSIKQFIKNIVNFVQVFQSDTGMLIYFLCDVIYFIACYRL